MKDDVISRQAAIDAFKEEEYPCESDYDEGYMEALDKAVWIIEKWLPSAQPEQKKGRWMNINESEKWECSECGRMMWFSSRLCVKPSDYRFCPNCGADMRGEEND